VRDQNPVALVVGGGIVALVATVLSVSLWTGDATGVYVVNGIPIPLHVVLPMAAVVGAAAALIGLADTARGLAPFFRAIGSTVASRKGWRVWVLGYLLVAAPLATLGFALAVLVYPSPAIVPATISGTVGFIAGQFIIWPILVWRTRRE
jgi:hypothetical protein